MEERVRNADRATRSRRATVALVVSILALLISIATPLMTSYGFLGLPTPGQTAQKERTVHNFFAHLVASDPDEVLLSTDFAAPSSPAYSYASARHAVDSAFTAEYHTAYTAYEIQSIGASHVTACRSLSAAAYASMQASVPAVDAASPPGSAVSGSPASGECLKFADIVLTADLNLVEDFTIDGHPVSSITASASGTDNEGGIYILSEYMYLSTRDNSAYVAIRIQDQGEDTGIPMDEVVLLDGAGTYHVPVAASSDVVAVKSWQTRFLYFVFPDVVGLQAELALPVVRKGAKEETAWADFG